MPRATEPPTFFRRLLRPLPIIGIVGSLVFAAWFVYGASGVWPSHILRRQKHIQAARIRQLAAQKQELEAYYAALKTQDVAALERAAREHGLVGPGETIYEIKVEEPKR